jgi:hypothetical protein
LLGRMLPVQIRITIFMITELSQHHFLTTRTKAKKNQGR